MAKFIRVSEVCGNDVVKTVLINVDTIEHIKVGNKGTDTFIKLITPSPEFEKRQGFFFVQETVEQIEQQLLTDKSRPPIMMNAQEYDFFLSDKAKPAGSIDADTDHNIGKQRPKTVA